MGVLVVDIVHTLLKKYMNTFQSQNNEGPAVPPPPPNSNGGMYNSTLESLIEMALADGDLTEKEKQVLFKRAQSQGIDLDEFEMVLDARLYERRKQLQSTQRASSTTESAPKSEKYGDVRKCPSCGAMIGTFVMSCPSCGHEFVGIGANSFVKEFAQGLKDALANFDQAQRNRIRVNAGGVIGTLQGLMDLQEEALQQSGERNERLFQVEADYVKTATLPRTKEDCIEMLNFVMPKIKVDGANYATKEWRKYYQSLLGKLEFEALNNKELLPLIDYYKKQLEVSTSGKVRLFLSGLSQQARALLILMAMGLGSLFLLLILSIFAL
jgi:hypothetical protein